MEESVKKDEDGRARFPFLWIGIVVGAVTMTAALLGGAVFALDWLSAGKILPGVRVAGVELGGLTKSEARVTLEKAIDAALARGLRFRYHETDVVLDAVTISTDPDVSRELIRYKIEPALERAIQLGKHGTWVQRLATHTRLRVKPVDFPPEIRLDRSAILDALKVALRRELHEAKNARFFVNTSRTQLTVQILPEEDGVMLITEEAMAELARQAEFLDFRTILLRDQKVTPTLTRQELEPLLEDARTFLRRPTLKLEYTTITYRFPPATFAEWLTTTGTRGAYSIAMDHEAFHASLKKAAGELEQEAKNGSFVVKDGAITSFVAGTEGREIDVEAITQEVATHWPASSTFPFIVKKTQGTLVGEDPEKLGIKELLGVGISKFSGSPVNRRKNIAHGVALVHGTIIEPDKTFSLLKALGPVDEKHKWLPELVIKGNETKPEFGGGLCQIGTTTFRGALASGLPILERQNHSYRVRYYEPAGTDATIYEPKPDFRFLNDTGHHIRINAYINGDRVFFEFWGTKDGRVSEQTKPVISNLVEPPPIKLVETLELKPGEKKCTETAHAGADAAFTYTITHPNGEVKKEIFRSHYRPWQAVCLIGVEKLTQPTDTSTTTAPFAG